MNTPRCRWSWKSSPDGWASPRTTSSTPVTGSWRSWIDALAGFARYSIGWFASSRRDWTAPVIRENGLEVFPIVAFRSAKEWPFAERMATIQQCEPLLTDYQH